MTDAKTLVARLREHAGQWDDETSTITTEAADAIEELSAALRECRATFIFAQGNTADGIKIDWEGLAREFNRRQKIAAEILAKYGASNG